MKEFWYRADYDYTPINYGGGTDDYFRIKVDDETNAEQVRKADEEALKQAKARAEEGDDFADAGHVEMRLVQLCEVNGEEETFPEIRTLWL